VRVLLCRPAMPPPGQALLLGLHRLASQDQHRTFREPACRSVCRGAVLTHS